MHKQRDIVLIPIPFTDLTSQKKRPAIIISSDAYNNTNEDIIVVAVTSNVEPRNFTVILNSDDLEFVGWAVPTENRFRFENGGYSQPYTVSPTARYNLQTQPA